MQPDCQIVISWASAFSLDSLGSLQNFQIFLLTRSWTFVSLYKTETFWDKTKIAGHHTIRKVQRTLILKAPHRWVAASLVARNSLMRTQTHFLPTRKARKGWAQRAQRAVRQVHVNCNLPASVNFVWGHVWSQRILRYQYVRSNERVEFFYLFSRCVVVLLKIAKILCIGTVRGGMMRCLWAAPASFEHRGFQKVQN